MTLLVTLFGRALLVTAICLLTVCPSLASPQIVAKNLSFDFGRIFQGQKVAHAYSFTNQGEESLQIEKVRTSCGCTAAILSSKTIATGESGEINVTFDSSRFRGPIKKTIFLHTNDPQRPILQFTLTGTVDQEIAFEPKRLILGPISVKEKASGEITLANRGTNTVTLKISRITLKEMEAHLEKQTLQPNESTRLLVEGTPPQGLSRVNGWIILDTNSPATSQLRIPFFMTVK